MHKKSQKIYIGKIEDSGEYAALYSEKENGAKRKVSFRIPSFERVVGYLQGFTIPSLPDNASRTIVNGLSEKDVRIYYPNYRISPLSTLEIERLTQANIRDVESIG